MAVVKVYSVSVDIAAGEICAELLHAEISESGHITGFDSVSVVGDAVYIFGDSIADEISLDALVADHLIEPLANLRSRRYAEIDQRTTALIEAGFTYDGEQFSLSAAAQLNWISLKIMGVLYTWPVDIGTLTNGEYSLTQVNIDAFEQASRDAIQGHLSSGRNLKIQITDAVDKVAVDAITDER
jgi:hypothetical protein